MLSPGVVVEGNVASVCTGSHVHARVWLAHERCQTIQDEQSQAVQRFLRDVVRDVVRDSDRAQDRAHERAGT